MSLYCPLGAQAASAGPPALTALGPCSQAQVSPVYQGLGDGSSDPRLTETPLHSGLHVPVHLLVADFRDCVILGQQSCACGSPWPFGLMGVRHGSPGYSFLPPGSMPRPPSPPCVPHRPLVDPQAVAALESEHRAELERLSSSLEAKHREVRGSWPWPARWSGHPGP